MNEKRIDILKRVCDSAIKNITLKANYCRTRVYSELDLKPLAITAAASRARGYKKWKNSNGIICDIINSHLLIKARKKTWSCLSRIWLKRYKANLTLSAKELSMEVISTCFERLEKKDKSIIGEVAKKYGLKSGKIIRKVEIRNDTSGLGARILFKMRIGCFKYTNELVRCLKVNPDYKNKCICCNSNNVESLKHLLLKCNLFNEEREKFLNQMISEIGILSNNPEKQKTLTIKLLLGGEMRASRVKPAEIVLKTIRYLEAIIPRRAAILAELARKNL